MHPAPAGPPWPAFSLFGGAEGAQGRLPPCLIVSLAIHGALLASLVAAWPGPLLSRTGEFMGTVGSLQALLDLAPPADPGVGADTTGRRAPPSEAPRPVAPVRFERTGDAGPAPERSLLSGAEPSPADPAPVATAAAPATVPPAAGDVSGAESPAPLAPAVSRQAALLALPAGLARGWGWGGGLTTFRSPGWGTGPQDDPRWLQAQAAARERDLQQAQLEGLLRGLHEGATRSVPAQGRIDCVYIDQWRCTVGDSAWLQGLADSAAQLRHLRPDAQVVLRRTEGPVEVGLLQASQPAPAAMSAGPAPTTAR